MSILTPKEYEKLYKIVEEHSNTLLRETLNSTNEIGGKMTDKEYAQYLFEWLRFNSSEDICAKCTNCPKDGICPNINTDSVDFDYSACFYGMKKYAEEQRLKKN